MKKERNHIINFSWKLLSMEAWEPESSSYYHSGRSKNIREVLKTLVLDWRFRLEGIRKLERELKSDTFSPLCIGVI